MSGEATSIEIEFQYCNHITHFPPLIALCSWCHNQYPTTEGPRLMQILELALCKICVGLFAKQVCIN